MLTCSLSVACLYCVLFYSFLLPFSSCWLCSCSVSCDGCVVAAHPLMSKLLICALPRLSAVCCLGCLSCLVLFLVHMTCLSSFSPNDCDIFIGLLLPWTTTMHLQTHPPSFPHPLKSWLAVAVTTSLLSCVRPSCTSCLLRLWHPALPVSCTIWWLPSRALSVIDCAVGNGVVHQNLGFLLTGTTTAKSVSTRSRERPFPWVTTPPSHRREY